jgi:3',5'-nucleoside bisphosphate phosphatase
LPGPLRLEKAWKRCRINTMIDLHIHSVASDGSYTAEGIVELVVQKGIRAFGIADHNATGSLEKAFELAMQAGLLFFPSVELDTWQKEFDPHLLAYGIDFRNEQVCGSWMKEIMEAKRAQTRRRVDKLNSLGFKIDFEELMKISGGKMPSGGCYVKALSLHPEGQSDQRVRTYIDGPRSNSPYLNFYLDWLKAGTPAFVPFEEMEITGVIAKAKKLGATLVLAHPTNLPEKYLKELIDAGLSGLEVYTSYHSPEMSRHWLQLARKYGLMITAGSDFHGEKIKPDVKLGMVCEEEKEIIENLSRAVERNGGIYHKPAGFKY